MFFIKSTICVLANNADWDCFHNLWGWCSYLVMGSQEIGYGYTFHYIKKEKYLSELSRETLYRDPRKKNSFDYLITAIIKMALNFHTLYIDVTTIVNLQTKNACAKLHHHTHLFHYVRLLYHSNTCKGPFFLSHYRPGQALWVPGG